ncbi:MAG: aminotransferase class I/II-fold pyridoxal phosphate-dependent enzyme [Corynebacterium sp.]|nr:aminotransferase class I/II-fold pyridoxal phosphate-dependent enzyme [Corynebacterium sp.]
MDTSNVDLNYHGDVAASRARLDFAVNVLATTPPSWLLDALSHSPTDLGRYPSQDLYRSVKEKFATFHKVNPESIALLNGASEAFTLLSHLIPGGTARLIHPSFTEPDAILSATPGITVERHILPIDMPYHQAEIFSGDLTLFTNPTNPTGRLHNTQKLQEQAKNYEGIIVVDEAFMDISEHNECHAREQASEECAIRTGQISSPSWAAKAAQENSNTLVLRSLTKTFSIAGIRLGYVIGDPKLIATLEALRPAWPLGTINLRALEAIAIHCLENPDYFCKIAKTIRENRAYLHQELRNIGWLPLESQAPYLLSTCPDPDILSYLSKRHISLRRCDTFPGLDSGYVRLAVRDKEQVNELMEEIKTYVGLGTCSVAQW